MLTPYQTGTFVARTLSWDGADFLTMKVSLSRKEVDVYDQSVRWWQDVRKDMESVLQLPEMGGTPKNLWRNYWSAHQRFFKELAICAKVPKVAKDALQKLEDGCSVVIGLQSTGEANTQTAMEEVIAKMVESGAANDASKVDLEDIMLPAMISTAGAVMSNFLRYVSNYICVCVYIDMSVCCV
jgi:hypothetical protein